MAEKRSDTPDWRGLASGKTHIIGADECGWGSLAGPLVVCAAVTRVDWVPPRKLNDSKQVSKARHEELFYLLRGILPHTIEMASAKEIDTNGAAQSLKRCFSAVVERMAAQYPNALIIIDGMVRISSVEHINFPEADGIVPAVMAASVLGKYTHDTYMKELAVKYPGYGFGGTHAGYGSKEHKAAIEKLGPCPEHRRSYLTSEDKVKQGGDFTALSDEGMSVDRD